MRARRTDRNHAELMQVLRDLGWLVADTHALPNWVDATAQRAGAIRLVDFKAPNGKLTTSQQKLIAQGWLIAFIRSVDDCIQLR